jgi:hypothetical protein
MRRLLLSDYLKEHPTEARQIRKATEGRCENCSLVFSPEVLDILVIGNPPETRGSGQDLQKHLLVLCPVCRRSLCSGAVTVSLLRELVRYRPRSIRTQIREILGFRPSMYIPPGTFDPAKIFQEMLDSGSLDLCLNGG